MRHLDAFMMSLDPRTNEMAGVLWLVLGLSLLTLFLRELGLELGYHRLAFRCLLFALVATIIIGVHQ